MTINEDEGTVLALIKRSSKYDDLIDNLKGPVRKIAQEIIDDRNANWDLHQLKQDRELLRKNLGYVKSISHRYGEEIWAKIEEVTRKIDIITKRKHV